MFKNYDDLEKSLTFKEVLAMVEKARDKKYEEQRFLAALKGIDLDEGKETEFDKIKSRAEAKARGLSEEQFELAGHFNIIEEDE
jgi:hypothetical protein